MANIDTGPDDKGQAAASDQPAGSRRQRVQLWLIATIAILLVAGALRVTSLVVMPFVLSIFVALLVAPVDWWVQQRVPDRFKWLGHAAAMAVIILILVIFFGSIWIAARSVATRFSEVSRQAGGADGVDGGGGSSPGLLESLTNAGSQIGGSVRDFASSLASTILGSATTTLSVMVLIFFFTLLMLIEAPTWRAKASNLLSARQAHDWFESFGVIARLVREYLKVRVILGLITGVLYSLWLWLFGVDLLFVWGLLAFLLNFIPTLGSLIAGGLAVLYAFVQLDFATAAIVAVGIFVIEQIMGNYIDPKLQGRQLSLSALVLLLALVVWGWIWGVAGALLAVPMTILIVVVCAHIPALRPFALLLSDEENMEGLDRMAKE